MAVPFTSSSRWLSRLNMLNNRRHRFPSRFCEYFSSSPDLPASSGPPPVRVAITELAGRGVFATREIGAGEQLHTAKPVVSFPSPSSTDSVCYLCLKKLPPAKSSSGERFVFCSYECREQSKMFCEVESQADWSEFDEHCRVMGLKYPFLVKRLACMVAAGSQSSDCLSILQPAILSHEMVSVMDKGYELLTNCLAKTQVPVEKTLFLTKQWYYNVLARLHLNSFRIELAMGSYEDLLSSAAACIEAEIAVGNAVYILPSFYNHDCDPNAHIVWIDNANARLKSLRHIEAGEEVRICYIDVSMDRSARQSMLSNGFGFQCNCVRCASGD